MHEYITVYQNAARINMSLLVLRSVILATIYILYEILGIIN